MTLSPDSKLTQLGGRCNPIPKSIILPFKEQTIYNFTLPLPAQPEAYCSFMYGSNWKQPDQKHQGHGKGLFVCQHSDEPQDEESEE